MAQSNQQNQPTDDLIKSFMVKEGLSMKDVAGLANYLSDGLKFHTPPVDPKTFLTSPQYLDAGKILYPEVLKEIVETCEGNYVEWVGTGAVGAAKTTVALYIQSYELYLLSCYRNPHLFFDLDPASEIEIIFQSLTASLAKNVDYKRFQAMIEKSPYFQNNFMFDKDLKSSMEFPRRIIVKPISGAETAAIGQNVIGGIIDEVNFMQVIERSRKVFDGGVYDQAVALYNTIKRRRESRFRNKKEMPGMLCLVSSKRYPGEFTDIKIKEAKTNPGIRIYDKRVWEIKPQSFSGEMFPLYLGDDSHKPRVLEWGDDLIKQEPNLIMEIPDEYLADFETDMLAAIRDIAGISIFATHPFITDKVGVAACFGVRASTMSREECDFEGTSVVISKAKFLDPEKARFCHIDLAATQDSAGVAMGYLDGFRPVKRGGHYELLPVIKIDFILRVKPPPAGDINFSKIREIIYTVMKLGVNIRYVSYDSWQSRDSIQILRQEGFITGEVSVDKTTLPYDVFKQAILDRRLEAPAHERAQKEILSLELDPKAKKIDHPPHGCFTGETRVALADGTCPTFVELSERDKPFYVYVMSPEGVVIAKARNARVTKTVNEIIEVQLDNFSVVRCTPEHLFMTLGGEWVQAQNLMPDISIMPLYRTRSYRGGTKDYERVGVLLKERGY